VYFIMEFWMEGPLTGIPALLQPVAHTLKQINQEAHSALLDFPEDLVYCMPAGRASVGFHLKHIVGVMDRMFTYAGGEGLSEEQFAYLAAEKELDASLTVLLDRLECQVEKCLAALKCVDERQLTAVRHLGRKRIEVTLLGLLFHSAEHGMRHLGALLVTAAVLRAQASGPVAPR
jgi:uncharacterized damage-inducible protein DinB